jgi:anaerobic glycerol-3-phosphate dehydrogenase
MYRGDQTYASLTEVRQCATEVDLKAKKIALIGFSNLADTADYLAAESISVAERCVAGINLDHAMIVTCPDFSRFDMTIQEFRRTAITAAQSDETVPGLQRLTQRDRAIQAMRALTILMPPTAGVRWFGEASSYLSECAAEQRAQALWNYLLTTPHVIVTSWASELARHAAAVGSRLIRGSRNGRR